MVAMPGAALRSRREAKGLSQEALAELAGIGRRTLQRAEVGERRLSPLARRALAEALGCSVDELFLHPARIIGGDDGNGSPPNGGDAQDGEAA